MTAAGHFGRRAGRILCAALAALLLVNPIIGCARYPRINHLHSDKDQKLMDSAVTNFKTVTEDQSLYAKRRDNLKVETEFRRVLMSKWVFNTDERNLTTMYARPWAALVTDLARAFGLPCPDNMQGGQAVCLSDALNRIPTIRARLGAIADTLNALSAAEAVIQKEMLKEVQAAKKAVDALNPPPNSAAPATDGPTATPLLQDFLKAYQEYRNALKQAGKEYADELLKIDPPPSSPILNQAKQIQLEILAAVDASRDPAAAYAIVAAVGTGLDKQTDKLLAEYVNLLAEALEKLKENKAFKKAEEETRKAEEEAKKTEAEARRAEAQAAEEIERRSDTRTSDERRVVTRVQKRAQAEKKDAERAQPSVRPRTVKSEIVARGTDRATHREDMRKAKVEPSTAPTAAPPSHEDTLPWRRSRDVHPHLEVPMAMENFFEAVRQVTATAEIASGRKQGSTPASTRFLVDGRDEPGNPAAGEVRFTAQKVRMLKLASANTSDNLQEIARALQDLRSAGRSTPARKAPASRSRAAAESTVAGMSDVTGGLATTLVNARLLNFDLAGRLGTKIDWMSDEQIKELNKTATNIVKDIFVQELGRQQRIAQFLADVLSIGVDLHGENKRHYDALIAVLGRELERWELLAHSGEILKKRYDATFRHHTPDVHLAEGLPLFVLDADNGVDAFIVDKDPNGNPLPLPSKAVLHPRVHRDNRVFDSLRSVASAGKAWQEVDPKDTPRSSRAAQQPYVSNVRTRNAVELMSSYLFMVSTNERFAIEDGIQLRGEISEHDIALDQIQMRAREAKLRYDLTDLQAYHATGITTQDIQTLLQLIQTGLIGWIGGRVN